jgi:malyl-CoA/(S)-citramalyl-CoA lyase
MGFDGKQCIHPNQRPLVDAIFTPKAEDAAHAEHVVAAYEQAVAEKRGVVSLNGKMIDAASVRMAQTILQKRRLIEGVTK